MVAATVGSRESVARLLHREGLAYALGASEDVGDMTAVLYGDPPAAAFGWKTAGVPEHGGYRWAIEQAHRQIEQIGAPAALRYQLAGTGL